MRLSRTRMAAMLAVATVLMISEVHAQAAQAPPSSTTSTAPTTTLSAAATPSSATTTPAAVDTASTAAATPTSTAPAIQTPGPAINPFPPGTINCLDMAGCGTNEECYVLRDGLVCLDKALNWGYILSKNISGVPSVPSWSGPRSQLNMICSVLPMPDGTDAPGLTLLVYDLIKDTLPKDLLTSRYDQEMYSWYTAFSNCEPHLACVENRCVARPTSEESCTSSWQCNPQALGLNENNAPIISANTSAIRCEYENGYKSQTMTCQLLHREASASSSGGFSAWHAIVPVVVVLVLIYFGSVIYQRRSRKRKLRKWSRVGEETDKEVSLILDESHIPGFPEDTLNVCNVIWRAVQIEPGESGLGAVEVVSQVSKPLADINVSIMQISTYDADFTLLPECDLTRALECLSKTFSITNNPLEDIGIQPEELQTWDTTFPMSPTEIHSLQDALSLASATTRGRQSSLMSLLEGEEGSISPKDRHANGREDSGIGSEETSEPGSGTMSGHGSHILDTSLQGLDPALISSLTLDTNASKARHHPFQVDFPHRLHITSMEHGLVGQLAIRLLESIFFDNRSDRFFSFTQTDTTLSIIMDDATMSLFPDHTLNTQAGNWRLIAIGDGPLGFDECGIVSEFSRPLSENGIGLFYLSTFNSDYIMVNDQDFEQAVACLQETARTVDWKRPSSSSPRLPIDSLTQDTKSIRSIDTSSLSGASSDVEAAELSPVSTTADASEIKADEGEGEAEQEHEQETALPLEEVVPA